MPKSIPAGLTKDHVIKAIADLDAGIDHPFGEPTGYVLIQGNSQYAPKAVVGVGFRHLTGQILPPSEFSGGEQPGQANYVLRRLGFNVVNKEELKDESKPRQDWTENEVQLIVADYFDMLETELHDKKYNKSEHRKLLLPKLSGRSGGSIEFKHQNISAVLVELGLPYIEGYKPRGNYQSLLATEVEAYLEQQKGFLDRLASTPAVNPVEPPKIHVPDFDILIEAPPDRINPPMKHAKPWISRKARKINFAERDAANRRLGKFGEQFVYDLERYRLNQLGRDDLSQKVQWVSQDIGDGLGFDILSFDETNDEERMVEVKATGLGKFFPFFVTSNEVRCSEDIPEQYQLFRVFDFGKNPRLYILHGSISELFQLDPVLYRAVV